MTATPPGPLPTAPSSARSLLLLAGLCIALFAVWRVTPLSALLDREHLASLGRAAQSSRSALAIMFLIYVAAGLLFVPITPLLAATALLFDAWHALVIGFCGGLTSATLGHVVGRFIARRRPDWVERPRLQPLRRRLQRRGIATMATVRLVPVGSFTLSNIVAGAIGIPLRDYLIGNALGILPGVLAFTFLAERLRHWGFTP
jgi:uncharacterized membrane protein YdjX (TVP38/TMEM64 family)